MKHTIRIWFTLLCWLLPFNGLAQNVTNVVCVPGVTTYQSNLKNVSISAISITQDEVVYYIPPYYRGKIIIGGSKFDGCGAQAADFYNYHFELDEQKHGYIPIFDGLGEIRWTGPGSEGFMQHYDQDCQGGRFCYKEVNSIADPNDPIEGDDFFYPFIKAVKTTSSQSFSFFRTRNFTDINGNISTYNVRGNVSLVWGEEPTMKHFHHLDANPAFSTRKILSESDIKVVADGSSASIITFMGGRTDYRMLKAIITENIMDDAGKYGTFSVIPAESDAEKITFRYQHPNNFSGSGTSKEFHLRLVDKDDYEHVYTTKIIHVYRSPLLLVHGLNSKSETFNKMASYLKNASLYEHFSASVKKADYEPTNKEHYVINQNVVPDNIDLIIDNLRNMNIAAGKVDIIGHSMGGLLSRIYLQKPLYNSAQSSSNTYRDDIHKLITLNTPHSGSQLANLLFDPTPNLLTIIKPALIVGGPFLCNCGAVEDLQVDSQATKDLNGSDKNRNSVPSHTITTIRESPDDLEISLFRYTAKFFSYVLSGTTLNSLFEENTHDWVVAQTSQFGGLGLRSCSSVVLNQNHSSTENIGVFNQVKLLLEADPAGNSFCRDGFNPRVYNYSYFPGITLAANSSASIKINSFQQQKKVAPGSSVAVNISGTGLSEIRSFVSYRSDSVYIVRQSGNTANFALDVDQLAGRRTLVALGKTPAGEYVVDSTYFYVVNTSFCESRQSGAWQDGATWTCGHEPTLSDIVIINANHTVNVSTSTAQAQNLIFRGGRIKFSSAGTKIFIKGDG